MMGRDMTPERRQHRSFREFLDGNVDIATGRIGGWAAFMQIATLSVSLAVGGTAILVVAALSR